MEASRRRCTTTAPTTSSHSSAGVRRSCSSRPARAFDSTRIRSEAQRTTTASSPTSSRRATRAASRPLPGSSAIAPSSILATCSFCQCTGGTASRSQTSVARTSRSTFGSRRIAASGSSTSSGCQHEVPRPRQRCRRTGWSRAAKRRRPPSCVSCCRVLQLWTFPIVTAQAGGAAAATRLATLRAKPRTMRPCLSRQQKAHCAGCTLDEWSSLPLPSSAAMRRSAVGC